MTFSTIFRMRGAFVAAILALFMTACSTSGFRADVSRFHTLAPASGETFQVIPGANVEDGIEFKSYLGLLVDRLGGAGYQVAFTEEYQYDVFLDYGSRADPNYRPRSGPTIGIGIGGFGSHVGGGVGTTINTSDNDGIYYLHSVNLVINDAETGQRLYEGTASGYGRGGINNVMSYLLDALFQNFPGVSGATETIKLETE